MILQSREAFFVEAFDQHRAHGIVLEACFRGWKLWIFIHGGNDARSLDPP